MELYGNFHLKFEVSNYVIIKSIEVRWLFTKYLLANQDRINDLQDNSSRGRKVHSSAKNGKKKNFDFYQEL